MLREVLALEDGQARPAMSTVFSAPRGAFAADLLGAAQPGRPDPARVAAALPVPLVDPADPAAAQLAAASREQVRRLAATMARPGPEVRLALARAELAAGDPAAALVELAAAAADDPDDWRIDWYRGVAALFTATRPRPSPPSTAPTSPSPASSPRSSRSPSPRSARATTSALAATTPCSPVSSRASPTPRSGSPARRCGRATGPPPSRALDAVPDTSSRHVAAQLAAIDATLAGRTGPEIGDADLRAAAARVPGLPLDPGTAEQVRTALFTAAVELRDGRTAATERAAAAGPCLAGARPAARTGALPAHVGAARLGRAGAHRARRPRQRRTPPDLDMSPT